MQTETLKSEPQQSNSQFEVATSNLDSVAELVHALSGVELSTGHGPQNATGTPGGLVPKLDRRPLGYQRRRTEQAPWPPEGKAGPGWQAPKPLPKRPTGRFVVGALLVCFLGSIAWHVWTTFFSVVAYGIVQADTLKMVAPWDGKIVELHFREGQSVSKGQLLITLDSSKLVFQLERLQEELQVETARLEAERIRVSQEAHTHAAQYFQMWGTLQKNREELSRLQQELELVKSINDTGVMSQQAFNRLLFSESGQREFVEKMTIGLEELRQRADHSAQSDEPSKALLEPIQARINILKGEIRRTQAEISHGEIRAPLSGIVTRGQAVVGQFVSSSETLLEIVNDESLKIELFVPQSSIDDYQAGQEVTLAIHPNNQPIQCTIVGSVNRFEAAPNSIQQYYRSGETLMPVILAPRADSAAHSMYVGSVSKFTLLNSLRGQ